MALEPNVGAELRETRERLGLSRAALANLTKINPRILEAIERNDIKSVPPGLFARAFLRAYAREVGLDPEDTVTRYLAQFHDEPPPPPVEPAFEPRAVTLEPVPYETSPRPGRFLSTLGVVTVGVLAYVAIAARSTPMAPRTEPPPAVEPAPVIATAGISDPSPKPLDIEWTNVKLELATQAECWIGARADGTQVVSRLMNAGEHQTIDAKDEITLRVGDPAALAFSVNGAKGRALGRPGEPVTVHITPANYRDFVAR